MAGSKRHSASESLERLSEAVTRRSGSSLAFGSAVGIVAGWALLGPMFDFSDTWQLVINTGTTIVTFLMVFLIQRAQNKDALAVHIKLNELVAAMKGASNRVVDVEAFTEGELRTIERHYAELARLARAEVDVTRSHSIEEARERHTVKHRKRSEP